MSANKSTKGRLWAVRTRKTKSNAWMPERVVVLLDGRPGDKGLLALCGWAADIKPEHEQTADVWPVKRLRQHLAALTKTWHQDCGDKNWKLVIVDVGARP